LVDDDPLLFLQYANAAETAQDFEAAIGAYESYLELQPNSPNAEQVEERIDQLKAVTGATTPSGSEDGSDGE
jgi:cytochrome c-type biogenesis protein CcmH/NrfG